jgi:hypothetical protein
MKARKRDELFMAIWLDLSPALCRVDTNAAWPDVLIGRRAMPHRRSEALINGESQRSGGCGADEILR